MFCTLVSSISLLTNKYCNCKSSFAFSVEKPGNKNRRTTHFILKVLLPLRRWVWIAISHWPLLSLCKGSLNIRAATSSGTLISPLQFWLYNVWAAVAAYSCFYKSCLCWESPEWTGTPQKSLCNLSQPWVMTTFTSPGTSLRALQRVTLQHALCFVDHKVVVVSEHFFPGKKFLYSLCIQKTATCSSNLQIYLLQWQVISNKTKTKNSLESCSNSSGQ